jgi:hypothetical protein
MLLSFRFFPYDWASHMTRRGGVVGICWTFGPGIVIAIIAAVLPRVRRTYCPDCGHVTVATLRGSVGTWASAKPPPPRQTTPVPPTAPRSQPADTSRRRERGRRPR